MDVRLGGEADYPQIEEFIEKRQYFQTLDCKKLGGTWILAFSDSGELRATLWFFMEPPHAYIDYWAGSGQALAALSLLAEALLVEKGIRYVRGVIGYDNTNAQRYAGTGLGMLNDGYPYALVYKEIAHGAADLDADSSDNASE
jgi:hypothetical protein